MKSVGGCYHVPHATAVHNETQEMYIHLGKIKPGTQGDPNDELDARHQGEPIPMSVQAGAVVAYNSDLVHRGGSNRGERARPVLYLTWMATDDGLLPLHMGYTLPPEDLGRWTVASLRPDADAERDRARLELD